MGVEDNQKDKKNSKIFVSVQIRSAALLACVRLICTVAQIKRKKISVNKSTSVEINTRT